MKGEASGCFGRNRSVPGNENRQVFTYQTRVSVTPEQDKRLREYAVLFGRVERTLYREMQKGADANRLKSEYLVRFAITARQFNAMRIQLQGKLDAIRKLASRTNRALTNQDWQSQEGHKPAEQTPTRLQSASSEAEAPGSPRTPFRTTGSGAQS